MTPTIPEAAVNAACARLNELGKGNNVTIPDVVGVLTAATPFLTGVTVKKLEWTGYGDGLKSSAFGISEFYGISGTPGNWTVTRPGEDRYIHTSGFKTQIEAKAAAQADYEARFWSMAEVLGNSEQLKPSARDCACTKIQQDESCPVGYPSLLCEICDGKGVVPSPRAQALEEGDLNARLKAKGMYTIDEMMGTLPVDKWRVHTGMTDLKFFGEWLEQKAREYLTMKAAYDAGNKDESDELYEWVLAHYAAFHDVLVNFRAALSHPVSPDMGVERPVEGGWLPIETAPKDGKIDIWATDNDGKGRRVTDCYYDRICDEWRTSAPALRLHCVKARYVTHWRPLPQAPGVAV